MKEPKHKQTNKQKSKKTVRGLIISNLYCKGIYHHYRPQQQQQLFIICTIKLESLCGALQHDWKVSTLEVFRRFQTYEYLTIIGRVWPKYRDLSSGEQGKSFICETTEFNNRFITKSPSLFFNGYLPFSRKSEHNKKKSVVSFIHEQNICSQTPLDDIVREQTIIFR